MNRTVAPDGTVTLQSGAVSFTFERPRAGVVVIRITGYDDGSLGVAPLDELSAELARFGRLSLYFDTSSTEGIVTTVREAWTAWFQANHRQLNQVTILVASRFVQLVVNVAKYLSKTGELMRVIDDPALFAARLAAETDGAVAR